MQDIKSSLILVEFKNNKLCHSIMHTNATTSLNNFYSLCKALFQNKSQFDYIIIAPN